jgi:hypothetical protein
MRRPPSDHHTQEREEGRREKGEDRVWSKREERREGAEGREK